MKNKPCTSHAEALALLGNRQSRKLENNTYLVRLMDGSNALAVRLHATNVVAYHASGAVELNTGGWYTKTTADRIYKYTPVSLRLWSDRGEWCIRYMGTVNEAAQYPEWAEGDTAASWCAKHDAYEVARYPNAGPIMGYRDGATLNPDGTISHATEDPHASRKLLRAIRNYAARYVAAYHAGEFTPSTAVTLIGPEHVRAFLGDGTYPPALLTAAMRYAGWTDYRRQYALSASGRSKHYASDLRAALRRYLYGILGLPGGHRPAVVTTAPGSLYGAVHTA